MNKVSLIALICVLTLYAPAELSILIVNYGLNIGRIFELCFIWVLYFGAVSILIKVLRIRAL